MDKCVYAQIEQDEYWYYTVEFENTGNTYKATDHEHGLILKQEIINIENERIDYSTRNGEKTEILTKTLQKFTWIDTETGERDENLFGANGMNEFEKGLGSALTYSERYFLLKFFHVPTDEDDIDNPKRKEKKQDDMPVVWM